MASQLAPNLDLALIHARPQRLDLQYLRASALAQARLQIAVLSGNRRRALEQIDRLVMLDKQLACVADGTLAIAPPPGALEAEIAGQRLAIASEKLALTSHVNMPRLEPAFGAGMGTALGADEEVEIVEDAALASRFSKVLLWATLLLALSFAAAVAALTL